MAELGRQHNTDLAKAFDALVNAGWANLSDGDAEAPTGHFALVHIVPAELAEIKDVLEACEENDVTIYPGSYIVEVDSDGNKTLIEYLTLDNALVVYNNAQREFAIWNATCPVESCHMSGPMIQQVLSGKVTLKCDNGHLFDPFDGMMSLAELRNRPLDAGRKP